MSRHIIAFEDKYYGQLVTIWYRAVKQTHPFLADEDLSFYYELVKNGGLHAPELWVELDEGGQARGFIGVDGTKIEMLFVDPDCIGKGIGSSLIRHVEGKREDTLQVDVNEQNVAALNFYLHYGFEITGRSELDPAGKPYPLLHMGKII